MNDLQTLFEGFTIHLEAAGRRPTTIAWYAKHSRRFFAWLEQEEIPALLDEITPFRVRKFVAHLQNGVRAWESNPYVPTQDRGLSSSYISGSVRALRAWFNWMEDEDYLAKNPMDKVRTPKQQQRLIEPLELDDIKRLLKAIEGQAAVDYRNRAIILTLLDCGLRVSELCQLEKHDVDLRGGWIRVRHGKGWKSRKVPIGGALSKALWQYKSHRPEPIRDNPYFFLTEQGWPLPAERVRKMLIHYSPKARVPNVHPHRFRHSFALHFLRNGGDPLTLRMLLGHNSLTMVSRYVQPASTDLKAVHAKASPADHLRL
jgi:site-specific recombinase XerD